MRRSSCPPLPPLHMSGCSAQKCVASAVISGAFHVFLLIRALDTAPCSLVHFSGVLTQDLESTREGRVTTTLRAGQRNLVP